MSEVKMGETKTQSQDEWLSGWLHQILYVTCRGIFSVIPTMPVEKVLMMISLTTARLIAEMYAGDELAVRRLRKGCRDIFKETLDKLPVVSLDKAPIEKPNTAAIGS